MVKFVNFKIMKFGYDELNVLQIIIGPSGVPQFLNFDILGRLRKYDTDTRESTFNYEGSKRLGEFDNATDEKKYYHWRKSQLLGFEDNTNTYYIIPDVTGSTKLIMNSNSVVNRLDYDHLGYLRNKTTDPQVELLWREKFYNSAIDAYMNCNNAYFPELGNKNNSDGNLTFITDIITVTKPSLYPAFPAAGHGNPEGERMIFWLAAAIAFGGGLAAIYFWDRAKFECDRAAEAVRLYRAEIYAPGHVTTPEEQVRLQ